jgi:leucyl aminopeptidase
MKVYVYSNIHYYAERCSLDMSRDKCGAAAVAGFLKTVSLLAPKHVNIIAGLALVRNSIGSDSYVSDEVLYSRNGTRGKLYFEHRHLFH